MTPEAPLRQTKFGLAPDGEGWFVVNAREIRWRAWERLGVYCDFEGKKRFKQLGFNISVRQPGESLGRYHRENAQEDFLVVSGCCVVIVEHADSPRQDPVEAAHLVDLGARHALHGRAARRHSLTLVREVGVVNCGRRAHQRSPR